MMDGHLNLMRREAARAMNAHAMSREAIVDSYDPAHYAVKVRIQPENALTGWLPVKSPWVGSGWGLFTPPTPGNVVTVHYQEGGKDAGYVSLCCWSTATPPLSVPSGEFWAVHQSGASVKMTNDGKLTVTDKAGSTIVMNGDGTGTATFSGGLTLNGKLTVNGDILSSGQITDLGGAHGSLSAMRSSYNAHVHPGVQSGSGSTQATTSTL